MTRVDANGAALAGSQLQTQLYVNRRAEVLNKLIGSAIPELAGAKIEWASPLGAAGYRELHDAAFLRAVGLAARADDLRGFWPPGGPVWDGLAQVKSADGRDGVLLAEGKSYPAELFGAGCTARPDSRAQIAEALVWTQDRLGLTADAERWMGRLYQSANRLAHLVWLREVVGCPAWFVHLLFTGDPHDPTTADAWQPAMEAAEAELGLTRQIPGAGHVLLSAGTREELIGAADASISFTVDGLPPGKDGGTSILNPAHPQFARASALLATAEQATRESGLQGFGAAPLRIRVLLEYATEPAGDAINYLGGIADVLESKAARAISDPTWLVKAEALGELVQFALYENDSQLRDAGIDQRRTGRNQYTVTISALSS